MKNVHKFNEFVNESEVVNEVNPNQLASGLNPNREMEKEIVKKQASKEELMDMRVNMLRLMKAFKNLGFSKKEVARYFEEEVKSKMKNTY
jgi:CHAD domain-containing protein|tara:strand:- start:389 stop:658 length:270 start_codon:yes stop_codon:yes gene_type:complete